VKTVSDKVIRHLLA